MNGAGDSQESAFAAQVAAIHADGTLGDIGRLRELFDFLAERGAEAPPATQAEIASEVFGNDGVEGDDATVRVYIHRLRKRLDDYYATADQSGGRLAIPSGTYALRLESGNTGGAGAEGRHAGERWWRKRPVLVALIALALVLGATIGRFAWPTHHHSTPVNPIWAEFVDDDRPLMVAVGDYFMFGEIDPFDPERGRLIRDFSVNSPTDLARAQEADPDRYGMAEDYGLTYLPLSSAYALKALMPVLALHDTPVEIVPASEISAEMLREYNVVYIGLISGMGLLEDINFSGSNYAVGRTYDELVDSVSGDFYISEEARRLASTSYYRDYGYFSLFREPGGARVAVVAGSRDTGLKAIAAKISGARLPAPVERLADSGDDFEALFEITGQQGADLSERLVAARKRR